MFKRKTKVKKLSINKVLIIMGIICTIFAVAIVLLTLLSNGEIELFAKSGSQMKENYATTQTNTWDVSVNGDGSVTATLDNNGLLTISGTGNMKNWADYESVSWYSVKEKIKNVEIENGVTSIGDCAFLGYNSLISIEIPEGVTSIGNYAFDGCSSLENIKIPSKVTSIGDYAFFACNSLTKIEISSGVTSIGDGAFNNSANLTSINVADDNTKYCDENGVLYTKDKKEIIAYPAGKAEKEYEILSSVITIKRATFEGCSSLESIKIPSEVTSIEYAAFCNCSALTNIDLPSGVTSIEGITFYGCSSLKSIEIPAGVTSIGKSAFYNCSALTNIVIPEGVTSIEDYTFRGCSSLTSLEIPEGVTSIGEYAFSRCSSLTTIEIPSGVTSLEECLFSSCSSLTNIEIPSGVTSIARWVFYRCSSLINIEVNESNEKYCDVDGVLYTKDMTKIIAYPAGKEGTQYEIPSNVTSVEYVAFASCKNLVNIEVNENNENYCDVDGVLYTKDMTRIIAYPAGKQGTRYEIPKSVTSIEGYVFDACSKLTSIEIPNSVTSIGPDAFFECSALTSIKIPDNVTYIGSLAFGECENLTIICKNDTTAETYAKENEIKYVIIIDGVKPKTTAKEIKTNLQSELQCEIVDLEGKAVTDTSPIGTGYKVKMSDGEEYSIIVWGDFTGDGKVSVSELARASRVATQEEGIGMKDKLILDVSGDGNIKVSDLAVISRLATE